MPKAISLAPANLTKAMPQGITVRSIKDLANRLPRWNSRRGIRRNLRRLLAEQLEDRRVLAALNWTGGAGNNLFSDAGNWNPVQVPTASDDVTISVAANPVIQISGNQSVNSLVSDEALVFSNGSSFTVADTADLNATANLNGAQLIGGSWDITGGELIFSNSANNRLTDVTLSGELRVVNNGYVELYGNTTFVSATIENTQNSNSFTRLYFEPGYVLNSDVTFIGTTTSNSNSAIGIDGTGTLTIAPGVTITSSYPAAFVGVAGNTLVNQGTINATSGRLSINAASFTNEGTVNATSANVVVNSTSFTNDGDIQVSGGTLQDSAATVWNDGPAGTISLDNSTLNLYGDIATSVFNFDVSGAFTRTNGGAINLRTNLDNMGDTLPLTVDVGDWTLFAGQITGGTVNQSAGELIFNNSTANRLTDVALTGELRVVNNAYVELYGNTTFVSATLENNINSNSFSRLLFEPGWELDSDITFIGSRAGNGNSNSAIGIDGTGTFTINPGVTITSSDPGALVGFAGNTLINRGTIQTDGANITTLSLLNSGIIRANNGGVIDINGDLTIDSPGILRSQNGVIRVSGNLLGDTRNDDLFVADGSLIFDGNTTAAQPQLIEVMGQDVAHSQTGVTQSFRYDRLNINSNTYVQLADTSDNAIGIEDEALYVNFLNVATNATLDLNGLNVYARAIVNNGTIIGGAPSQVPDSGAIAINQNVPGNISTAGELDEWQFFGRRAIPIGIVVNPRFGTAASHVDWVNVQLLDANDNLIASGQSSVAGGLVTLSSVDLPTDGDYRIQVRAASGHASNTGAYLIGLHESIVDEYRLQLNQTSRGSIGSRFNIDQWEFVAAAGDQVAFDHLASNGSAIGFDLNGPNEWSGFTGITNDSPLITLPESGNYILTARGLNAQWGGEYAFELNQTPQQDLMFGEDVIGEFSGGGQAMLYRLDVDTATPVSIFLDDTSATNSNELYLKRGAPPTRSDFDFSSIAPSADQRITIGNLPTGSWFVLAYQNASTQASSFTLRADPFDVLLTDVTPSQHGNAKDAQLTITGLGFETGTTLEFVASDTTVYAASSAERDSFERFTVTVPAGSLPIGTYSVRATLPSGSTSVLASSFEVTEGGEAILETNLLLPGAVGRHAIANIFVEYSNTGTIAMPAPLLVLRGTDNALLTLDQSRVVAGFWTSAKPEGFDDTIQFLASGEIPGLLLPGESVSVPVYYAGLLQPWDFSDTSVDFNLEILTVEDTRPINWQEFPQPSWINDDAWDVVAVNLEQQVGETWGDYIRVLSENASYLGRIGRDVSDVADLWDFEIQQAIGLTAVTRLDVVDDMTVSAPGLSISFGRAYSPSITQRNDFGPFGYGWNTTTAWMDHLDEQADGLVVLTSPDGGIRRFQPDRRRVGAFFSPTGDPSQLRPASGGGYILNQPDGTKIQFGADGRVSSITDRNLNQVASTWQDSKLTRLTHSSGAYLEIQYNPAGLISAMRDSNLVESTFTYDANSEFLIAVNNGAGIETLYSYADAQSGAFSGALTGITYADGRERSFLYDSRGRLTQATRPQDTRSLTYSYDTVGRVFETNALGDVNEYSFDHLGSLASYLDAAGNLTRTVYDDNRNLVGLINAEGLSQFFAYDSRGNLTKSIDALGDATHFAYTSDFNRLATVTDANNNTNTYRYDSRGNLVAIRDANGAEERFNNDVLGQLSSQTNRRGQTIDYVYNADGRLESEILPDGNFREFQYDSRGNLIQVDTLDGSTLIRFDDASSPTRPTSLTNPDGRQLTYQYLNDQLMRLGYPDETAVIYQYDEQGRLEFLKDQDDELISQFFYDMVGRRSKQVNGNGAYTEYEFDELDQIIEIRHYDVASELRTSYAYTYDSLGRPTSMATPDGQWQYQYDAIGQLTQATFISNDVLIVPNQDLRYIYDALGNRTQTIFDGVITDYISNNLNQYTQIGDTLHAYDLDGNLVSRTGGGNEEFFTYDAHNRLVSAVSSGETAEYAYDSSGGLGSMIVNGNLTDFVFDPFASTIVAQYNQTNLVSRFVFAGTQLIGRSDTSGESYYFELDAIGSVVGITDASGAQSNRYDYRPFGDLLKSTVNVENAFEFVGGFGVMQASHELDFMRARFYSSGEGRFRTADPIGIVTGDANFYTYAANLPTSNVDPSGLDWVDASLGFGGSVLPSPAGLAIGFAPTSNGREIGDGLQAIFHERANCGLPGLGGLNARRYSEFLPDGGGSSRPGCGPEPPPQPPGGGQGGSGSGGAVGSFDPNEKTSAAGFGPQGFVSLDSVIPYRIDFENFEDATAPAQRVVVTDQLDQRFDFTTLQFTQAGFGDERISIPTGQQYFQTTVPFPVENGARPFDVDIEIDFNPETGMIRAVFQSIDPQTSLPPDVLTGFLPPEDGTGRGQGFFSFTIETDEGLQSGDEIRNVAVIVFDINQPITTNQIDPHDPSEGTDPDKEARITIDAGRPQSTVEDLIPESETLAFPVAWQGQDDANGSGVSFYDIYVSTNNGPFELWLDNTTETSAVFTGMDLTRYGFYSVATDNVRQREDSERIEQAFTLIDLPKPPVADAGGDYEGIEGGTILFDATGSTDPNNDISIYEWDLNYDGVSFDVDITGVQPLVLFDDDIIDRTIAVRVTDLKGLSDIATSRLNVLNVVPEFSSGTENESLGFTAAGLFERTVSFTDPGDDAPWSGTVNYGDGTSEPLVIDQLGKVFALAHTYTANGNYTVELALDDGDGVLATASFVVTVALPVELAGSNVFYYKSTFAGGANAPLTAANVAASTSDKVPLLPGETATSANYTHYSRGLNGILIDLENLLQGTLEDVQFEFHVGNNNFPSTWLPLSTAPTITPVPGNGTSPDRLLLTWDDKVVQNTWLQVTILAKPAIGLLEPIVQYWGNAIGDTFNDVNATPPSTKAFVNAADVTLVRANPRNFTNPAPVNFPMDVNKDRFVNSADVTIIRSNSTNFLTALNMITPADPANGTLGSGSSGKRGGGKGSEGFNLSGPIAGLLAGPIQDQASKAIQAEYPTLVSEPTTLPQMDNVGSNSYRRMEITLVTKVSEENARRVDRAIMELFAELDDNLSITTEKNR